MENINKKRIEIGENTNGEGLVQKLAIQLTNFLGDSTKIREILKTNHINTNTVCLNDYIDLLGKAPKDLTYIGELIRDIGSMIVNEQNIFNDSEIFERNRTNPVWKDHQNILLEDLNKTRRKYNLRELELDEKGVRFCTRKQY